MDTDGPFEQAPCGSTHHSGHHGLLDSQWAQYSENVAWYQKLKGLDCGSCLCPSCGLYLGVPDPYYFQGGINTEPIGFTDAWGRTADNDEHERHYDNNDDKHDDNDECQRRLRRPEERAWRFMYPMNDYFFLIRVAQHPCK